MSHSQLPERASLEFLKKLAKDRLKQLRQADPNTQLATALLDVAREYGFPSWRALKAELEHRQERNVERFFEACARGDAESLVALLALDPSLVRATKPNAPHGGWTGLHTAAQNGRTEPVQVLLRHGADHGAREAGDNTIALHWAVAGGKHVETARALLDAGSDVHGFGDVHELDVIGWATFYRDHEGATADRMVHLLLERGARHHIFSAIAMGDLDLIRRLVEENPSALDRRLSRFERGQTAVHFAMSRKRYDILDLLIELGADLEAEDGRGQTPLAVAMLEGDQDAMKRLHAAGAKPPEPVEPSSIAERLADLARSTRAGVPMIGVPDIAAALDWYVSIGFSVTGRYEADGVVNFGMVSFGKAELMFRCEPWGEDGRYQGVGRTEAHDVSLWFYTDRVDDIYRLIKSRQLAASQAVLQGEAAVERGIDFVEDLYDAFYGARQFSVRDLNGYTLVFIKDT